MAETPRTVEEDNAIAEARQRAYRRELHRAFVETFGPPDAPTPHGRTMLKYLNEFAGEGLPKCELTDSGATDIARTFRKLGQRDVVDAILNKIRWRESNEQNSGGRS